MWSLFIDQWNGIGLFLSSQADTSETLSLFTDSSSSIGYRRFFQTRWFQGKWLPHQHLVSPGISILQQELFAFIVASHLGVPVDIQVDQVPLRQFGCGRGHLWG